MSLYRGCEPCSGQNYLPGACLWMLAKSRMACVARQVFRKRSSYKGLRCLVRRASARKPRVPCGLQQRADHAGSGGTAERVREGAQHRGEEPAGGVGPGGWCEATCKDTSRSAGNVDTPSSQCGRASSCATETRTARPQDGRGQPPLCGGGIAQRSGEILNCAETSHAAGNVEGARETWTSRSRVPGAGAQSPDSLERAERVFSHLHY